MIPRFIAVDIGDTLISPITGNWYVTKLLVQIIKGKELNEMNSSVFSKNIRYAKEQTGQMIFLPTVYEEYQMYCVFYQSLFNAGAQSLDRKIIEKISYDRAYGKGHYRLLNDTVESVKQLSCRYKLGLFSNTYPSVIRFLKEQGLLDFFSINVLSYQEGIKKPDKKMFERLTEKTGLDSQEILIIDDNPNCILTAGSMGFQICQKGTRTGDEILKKLCEDIGL